MERRLEKMKGMRVRGSTSRNRAMRHGASDWMESRQPETTNRSPDHTQLIRHAISLLLQYTFTKTASAGVKEAGCPKTARHKLASSDDQKDGNVGEKKY